MGSSKPLGHGIPSLTLPYYHKGSKDASLATKAATFLLLSIIKLEEGGEVHMHYTRELVHTRTITLHYCSTYMQTISYFFTKFFYWGEIFFLVRKLDPVLYCSFLRGGVSHEAFSISSIYCRINFLH